MTILAAVFIIGTFVTITVFIVAKQVAAPHHRIADALENINGARAADLSKVRADITSEIDRTVRAAVDGIGQELDRHVEETGGGLNGLSMEVDRIDTNVGRVAGAVADVTTTLGVQIAGNDWWTASGVPLQERVRTAYQSVEVAPPQQSYYHQGDRPVSPGATALMPRAREIGEHTGVILSGDPAVTPAPGQPYPLPPFDAQDPQSVFTYFMDDIRSQDPQALPWGIHPQYEGASRQYTYYEVFRAQMQRRHGLDLPGEHALFNQLPEYRQLTQSN